MSAQESWCGLYGFDSGWAAFGLASLSIVEVHVGFNQLGPGLAVVWVRFLSVVLRFRVQGIGAEGREGAGSVHRHIGFLLRCSISPGCLQVLLSSCWQSPAFPSHSSLI